jgi:Rod binding domain-containing protein
MIHAHHAPHQTGGPMDLLHRPAPPSKHDQLVKHSQHLVAQTFFGTLLKQMHEGPFKSKIFDGGRGGQAFSSLLDQHLSEHMARGAGHKLVDGMVRRIEKKTGTEGPKAQPKKSEAQTQFERSGYRKAPVRGGKGYVPANIRA